MSSEQDLSKLTVLELKKICTDSGVSTKGTKSQIVARLMEHRSDEGQSEDDANGMEVDNKKEMKEDTAEEVCEVEVEDTEEGSGDMEEAGEKEEEEQQDDNDGERDGEAENEEDEAEGDDNEAEKVEEDAEKAEDTVVEGAEDAETKGKKGKKEKPVAVEKPLLTRGKFVFMYGAINSLRTVLVKPFKPELAWDEMKQWVEKAKEYEIKSDRDGTSAAALYFETNDLGDMAFRTLKTALEASDIEVYHPPFTSKTACLAHEWFTQMFTYKVEDEYSHRMVLLENVPESVTEMDIKEKFPDAFNFIFYGSEINYKGIVTMELQSESKVQELLEVSTEVEINGEKFSVHKLNTRINKWTKEMKLGYIKPVTSEICEVCTAEGSLPELKICRNVCRMHVYTNVNERDRIARETKEIEDEERIEKCKRYHECMQLKDTVKDRTDLFSDEKIKAHEEYALELKFLSVYMMNDTDRRYNDTKTFPEPEEIMLPYTKQIMSGRPTREAKESQKQEKKKQQKDEDKRRGEERRGGKHGKSQKRSSNSPYGKGGPPHKKAHMGDDGWGHGGRKGGYNKGGNQRGSRDHRDYEDRSRRGNRDRHGGGYGNVQSKMETAILTLAEKMSQLERLQQRSGGGMGGNYNQYGDSGNRGYGGGNDGYGDNSFGGGYSMGGGASGSGGNYGGGNYNSNRKHYGGGGGGRRY